LFYSWHYLLWLGLLNFGSANVFAEGATYPVCWTICTTQAKQEAGIVKANSAKAGLVCLFRTANRNFQTPRGISGGRLSAAAPVREVAAWLSPPALAVTARNWRRRIRGKESIGGLAASAFDFAA
jgi:hypothetical protein